MKRPILLTIVSVVIFLTPAMLHAGKDPAMDVIKRFMPDGNTPQIKLSTLPKVDRCDQFEVSVRKGRIEIAGSSPTAQCRAFYDYLRGEGAGIASWSGNRADLPSVLENMAPRRVVSPTAHHFYFNPVTYGYTMPYWNWARWEQEIDWMALHGIDMPLALVANEAITARVWRKLGLTEEEISEYFVGPAYLPWMRMGNISGLNSPMPAEWQTGQVELQHKILDRMRSLGMKPICPGFAGFVPKAMRRLYPDLEIVETSWGGAFHNWMVAPNEELFTKIGEMFIREWEAEFGPNEHYIVDSFNELEIPFPPHETPERYKLLANYGETVYSSIKAGNPNAVWVMQGWMFGYQRHIWDYKTLEALVSRVPDDKMMLLDLSVDYSMIYWGNGANWEFYKGFYNKPWVYSVIPNMGGKCGLTGVLDFYANGHLAALRSANRGRLEAIGMAPEGIENNEVVYELMADAGWSRDSIDTKEWLRNYSQCRYGNVSPAVDSLWSGLCRSVYGSFTDHPRYNWQLRPGMLRRGSINASVDFFGAVEDFTDGCASLIKNDTSPDALKLLSSDVVEFAVAYLGGKAELLTMEIDDAYMMAQWERAAQLEARFDSLMTGMDRLLESHPTQRLAYWLDFARAWAGRNTTDVERQKQLADYYEADARRIVTIWGPPVDDYSARIWSGLIRDYYLPRWRAYFKMKHTGEPFDFAAWELDWVENQRGISECTPYDDPIAAAVELVNASRDIASTPSAGVKVLGSWTSADLGEQWSLREWSIPVETLGRMRGIAVVTASQEAKIEIENITLELDGTTVKGTESTPGVYTFEIPSGATANNRCLVRAGMRHGATPGAGRIILVE